jgi:hypothetical protein
MNAALQALAHAPELCRNYMRNEKIGFGKRMKTLFDETNQNVDKSAIVSTKKRKRSNDSDDSDND